MATEIIGNKHKTMKQYTNESQTAKLIELGFKKPKGLYFGNNTIGDYAYTIGELIEMLPKKITNEYDHQAILQMTCFEGVWRVKYSGGYDLGLMLGEELVDALYYMAVQLKEEGVI